VAPGLWVCCGRGYCGEMSRIGKFRDVVRAARSLDEQRTSLEHLHGLHEVVNTCEL